MIGVWCDQTEHDFIRGQANDAGVSAARYLRQVGLGQRRQAVMNQTGRFADHELQLLWRELVSIGRNVNQLARIANTTGQQINTEKLEEMRQGLARGIDHIITTTQPKRSVP